MAKSLVKVRAEIDRLQRSFDAVIATMKKDIAFHGLTVEDLFGSAFATSTTAPAQAAPRKEKSSSAAKAGPARVPKYGDASGNVWGGMGKRPAWLVAAIDAGKTKESFLLSSAQSPVAEAAPSAPSAKDAPAKKSTAKKVKASKTAAPAEKAIDVKVTPAKRKTSGKAATQERAATPSKKPPIKSGMPIKKPSSAVQKASASSSAKNPKTAATEEVGAP